MAYPLCLDYSYPNLRRIVISTSLQLSPFSKKASKEKERERERRKEKKTYDHLLQLIAHTHPLHDLNVLQARKDLMLDLEGGLHAELRAFFDGVGLVLERLERAGLLQVYDDVRPAFDLLFRQL